MQQRDSLAQDVSENYPCFYFPLIRQGEMLMGSDKLRRACSETWDEWGHFQLADAWVFIALSCGIDPSWMDVDSLDPDLHYVPQSAARCFLDRMELVIEHLEAGVLSGDKELADIRCAVVDRSDFVNWARRFTVDLHEEFLTGSKGPRVSSQVPADFAEPTRTLPSARWPWGSHETSNLRLLAEAAERFWKPVAEGGNYDPQDDTTAPTNEQVEAWLLKRGVSGKARSVMATILRADKFPMGRRSNK